MKIFISYRRADSKYVVDRIRDRLIAAYDDTAVFRDIESIPLGENFSSVLDEATSTCNVMLVIIGPLWAGITDVQGKKRLHDPGDFTRIEIEAGLKREEILVIPVLVMNATMPTSKDLPGSLSNLTYRNAISVRNDPDFDHDIKRLILGINQAKGGTVETISIEYYEPETVFIPQGPFWMGSAPASGVPSHESPRHEITLPNYRIGKYPVKNAQYEEFTRQTRRSVAPEMGWNGQRVPAGADELPVIGVTFYDALAYCQWLVQKINRKYSLPNEAQWEKACRDGLFSNVCEWTCTLWGEKRILPDPKYSYPWKDDGRNDINANRQIRRVVRGGVLKDNLNLMRCSARSGQTPDDVGLPGARHSFRVVMTF